MYWKQELETMPPETLKRLQLERLQWTVAQASKSPHYSKVFAEKEIKPESIQRMEDIHRLPFTSKDDLRSQFPYGLLGVDLKDVIRLHSSSGTSGQATVVFHSQ